MRRARAERRRDGHKWMNNLAHRILAPVNTAAIVLLGAYTTVWGIWVVNPFWNVFGRASLYSWMNAVMPEHLWGLLALVVGILMLYGVIRHSYHSLITGALVGYFHWLLITVMYFGGDWQNTGGITAAIISIYCAFIWLNIRKNRKELGL